MFDTTNTNLNFKDLKTHLYNSLDEIHEISDYLSKVLQKYKKIAYTVNLRLTFLSCFSDESPITPKNVREEAEITNEIPALARRTAEEIVRFSERHDVFPFINEEENIYLAVDLSVDGIRAYADADALYVRTPLPVSRCRIRSGKNKSLEHSSQFYAAGVTRAIDRNCDMDLLGAEKFMRKTIFYLFVLNSKTRRVDNDNYDTTALTNSIAGYFSGGDSPLRCRMVYDSVLSEELEEGAYITVLPYDLPLPSADTVIRKWLELLKQKSKNGKHSKKNPA